MNHQERRYLITGPLECEDFVRALFETLSITFRQTGPRSFSAEMIGGVRFELLYEVTSDEAPLYLLRCIFDAEHPQFQLQQRHFGTMDELHDVLRIGLGWHGMKVVEAVG